MQKPSKEQISAIVSKMIVDCTKEELAQVLKLMGF